MKNPATLLASLVRDRFAGGGAMRALIRSMGWSKTAIGDVETLVACPPDDGEASSR